MLRQFWLRLLGQLPTGKAPTVQRLDGGSHVPHVNQADQGPTVAPKSTLELKLKRAISQFPQSELAASTFLFHGCKEFSRDVVFSERKLGGTRKWFSQNAEYATDYSGPYTEGEGRRTLWICKISKPIPALIGSQSSLKEHVDWPLHEFPWKLPNEFPRYARNILRVEGTVALLDHQSSFGFDEVLISEPFTDVDIVDIVILPECPDRARREARRVQQIYLPQMPSSSDCLEDEPYR